MFYCEERASSDCLEECSTKLWTKFQVEIPYFGFFRKYPGMGQKFNKTTITFEGRSMGEKSSQSFYYLNILYPMRYK
jgi:hypothetical protein